MGAGYFNSHTECQPCWHCSRFIALVYDGSAAECSLPNGPRIRSMPAWGCAAFERQPGADDDDHAPLPRQMATGGAIRPGGMVR